jgi:opacity protein-like surface antigen
MKKKLIAAALVLLFFAAQNGFSQSGSTATSALPPPDQDTAPIAPPSTPAQASPSASPSAPPSASPSTPAQRTPSAPKQTQPSRPSDGGAGTGTTGFSLSAGGRIFYNGVFTDSTDSYDDYSTSYSTSNNGFGIGVFLDATYVEIGLDFIFSSTTYNNVSGSKMTQFSSSLLGKYPFAFDFAFGNLVVFPLLGISSLSFSSFSYDDGSSSTSFSFAVGGGLDYNLTDKLYLRSKLILDLVTSKSGSQSRFTFGPHISIGFGYKL